MIIDADLSCLYTAHVFLNQKHPEHTVKTNASEAQRPDRGNAPIVWPFNRRRCSNHIVAFAHFFPLYIRVK